MKKQVNVLLFLTSFAKSMRFDIYEKLKNNFQF